MSQRTRKLVLYSPHEKQLEFHNSQARFRVIAFGRQSGKSTACNNELLKRAWDRPESILWYISPTYDSARIMFRRACVALRHCPDLFKDNKSELIIELVNGSKIFYKSGEVLENLRSETLHGVVIDEVRNQSPDLWTMIIRPMLVTTNGWAAFISTPNGFDHFYDLYNQAKADSTGNWAAMTAPSTCNPLIDEEEMENAKIGMTDAEFAQEYLAEFRDLTSGKAYLTFGEHNYSAVCPWYMNGDFHPQIPILVAMDFNLSPMAWTLGQKKIDQFHWFDEVWLKNSHTPEAAKVLALKIIERGHEKVGVVLCGDATSKAGQRAAAGQSDYDIVCKTLDDYKIKWVNMTPDSNPQVKDRVNTLNAKCRDASGGIHLTVNPKTCPMLLRDMQRVVWKPGTSLILDQTTNRDLTHSSDGVGYAVCALSPLVYDAKVPQLRIILR